MPSVIYVDEIMRVIVYEEGEPPIIGPAGSWPVFQFALSFAEGPTKYAAHNLRRQDAVHLLSAIATELGMEVTVREKVPGATAPGEPGVEPFFDSRGIGRSEPAGDLAVSIEKLEEVNNDFAASLRGLQKQIDSLLADVQAHARSDRAHNDWLRRDLEQVWTAIHRLEGASGKL